MFFFPAGSKGPIALLELGLWVGRRQEDVVVGVEEGFWKKGNVEVVCGRFGVRCLGSLGELGEVVRERVGGLLEARDEGEGVGGVEGGSK